MSVEVIALSPLPGEALAELKQRSRSQPVLVFKKSPVCPVSFAAEHAFRDFCQGLSSGEAVQIAEIDVIAEKPLARGLTAALEIRHESPQALLFHHGELVWHASHEGLTESTFRQALGDLS